MNNAAIFTVTEVDGNSVTSYSQLFLANRIVKATQVGGFAVVEYLDGEILKKFTLNVSLSAFNAGMNGQSVAGKEVLVGILDATDGLSVGTHDLVDENGNAITLQDNARVWDGYREVLTTFTDGADDSATIALGIETDDAAGIFAAAAISSGTTWDAAAPKAIIQDGTITNISEKTTAAGRKIQAVVADDDLTAGVLRLVLEVINIGA